MDVDLHVRRSWTGIPPPPPAACLGVSFTSSSRETDWGLVGPRKVLHRLRGAFQAISNARSADALMMAHVGSELEVAACLPKRMRLFSLDYLIHDRSPSRRSRVALQRVDGFVCIRSGDIAVLRELGVQAPARFVPFPAPSLSEEVSDQGYVYAGGWAGRDWSTAGRAIQMADVDAIVATNQLPTERRIRSVGIVSPEQGRRLAAGATIIVVPFADVTTAAGPLVLLDAMALGKPIVVPDVNASRDYVEDGVSALVVPPGDSAAMAEAICRLMTDTALRYRLGLGAAEAAATYTPERLWRGVADFVQSVVG